VPHQATFSALEVYADGTTPTPMPTPSRSGPTTQGAGPTSSAP
jgi:hypothetical protein